MHILCMSYGFLWISFFYHALSEFPQKLIGMSLEFIRIHQSFTGISNRSTLKTGDKHTTRPSHRMGRPGPRLLRLQYSCAILISRCNNHLNGLRFNKSQTNNNNNNSNNNNSYYYILYIYIYIYIYILMPSVTRLQPGPEASQAPRGSRGPGRD